MVLRIIILSFIGIISTSSIYDINKKKIEKKLSKVWPELIYTLQQQPPVEGMRGEYYKVFSSDVLIAHLILDEAPGKVDSFSYMVLFSPQGIIENVSVLQYRENYGGEIASKRFLKQYIGKKNGESMEYLQDIDGISGATISVRAINHGIKQNSLDISNYLNSD